MTSDSDTGSAAGGNELSYKTAGVATGDAPPARRRVWFPVALAAVYWAAAIGMARMEVSTFVRFLTLTAILAVVLLGFLGWWLFTRRVSWATRLLVLAAVVAAPVVGVLLADKSLGPITVTVGLPIMFAAWAAWLLLARKASPAVWRNGMVAAIFLPFLAFALFRMEGLSGSGDPDLHWRWSARPGERYASGAIAPAGAGASATSVPTTQGAPTTPLALRRGLTAKPAEEFIFPILAEGAADIKRKGGYVPAGAHGEQDGLGTHWEVWSYAAALTPMEALEAASLDGAHFLGLEKEI